MSLDRLARVLTGMAYEDPPIDPWHGRVFTADGKEIPITAVVPGTPLRIDPGVYDEKIREWGGDWPARAETMIGLRRLQDLETLVKLVARENVPGDLLEAGVWRGGAAIFMRAVLADLEDPSRKVFVCDSFDGLPPPTRPEDSGDFHHAFGPLRVPLTDVMRNFDRYGLRDDRVVFVQGLFAETLHKLDGPFALIRLDGDMYGSTMDALTALYPKPSPRRAGDMYGSTMDALTALYPKLSPGGVCILDDFNLPPVRKAVSDYLGAHLTEAEIVATEKTMVVPIKSGHGVYWRKP